MLTIHMRNRVKANGVTSSVTLEELLRTVRVISEVPFIEPVPGVLLNLAAVERIDEERELGDAIEPPPGDETAAPGKAAPLAGLESCQHGYFKGTCSRCNGGERGPDTPELPIGPAEWP